MLYFFYAMITTFIGNTYVELVRDGAQTVVQAYCHGLGGFDNSATLGVFPALAGDTGCLNRLYENDRIFVRKTIFWALTLRLYL